MSALLSNLDRVLGRGRRRALAGLTFLTSLSAVAEVAGLLLVLPLVKLLVDPGVIFRVPVLERIYRGAGFESAQSFTLMVAGSMFAVFLLKNVFVTGVLFLQHRFARAGVSELSRRLQELYLRAPYVELLSRNTAELARNVRQVVPSVYHNVILGMVNLVAEACVVLGIGVALYLIEPRATVIVAAVVAALLGIQYLYFGSRLRRWGRQALEASRDGQRRLGEALRATKEVRILGREAHFLDTLARLQDRESNLAGKLHLANQAIRPTTETGMLLAIFVVVAVVVLTDPGGDLVSRLALFALASMRLLPALNRFFRWWGDVRNGLPALDVLVSELDRFAAPDGAAAGPSRVRRPFREAIRMEQLAFAYPDRGRAALAPTSETVQRGAFVGIVGPSGAGKSTLMDLILGLLAPTGGRLLVDGADVAADRPGWQANIGYVPQSIFFVDDTLRRNVALGIPDPEIDDARVLEALRLARLGDFVADLPRGLDTTVGEAGIRMSGGQRRRIGIARALYHDPEVLVLDEAMADLDRETVRAVTETLRGLAGQKTVILVTHDLSTARDCDTVLYLRDGRVVDRGAFDGLVRRHPELAAAVAPGPPDAPGEAGEAGGAASR